MSYIRVTNGIAKHYNIKNLHKEYPNTSIPDNLTDTFLAEYDIFPLHEIPQPNVDDEIEQAVEIEPEFIDGVWKQRWEVIALEPNDY